MIGLNVSAMILAAFSGYAAVRIGPVTAIAAFTLACALGGLVVGIAQGAAP